MLTLDRIAEEPDSVGDAVAVTFDDAFSTHEKSIGCLLSHGIPTSMFVVSGRVGGRQRLERESAARNPDAAAHDLDRSRTAGGQRPDRSRRTRDNHRRADRTVGIRAGR